VTDRLLAGLDVGGTKTLAAAVDPGGVVVATIRMATRHGADGLLVTAEEALRRLCAELGVEPGDLEAVGVGVPGVVDQAAGSVRFAVNLGIDGQAVALGEHLAAVSGAPVVVDNDVNAAAVGAAAVLGTGDDLAYLSVGTGVAAGLVLDGRLRRGRRGIAGEIGHLPLDPAGPPCGCGQRGCLEVLTSGAALGRRWVVPDGGSPAVALAIAAGAGDTEARRLLDDLGGHLATAVTVLALAVDTDVIVLGGGVAEAGPVLLDAVRAALVRRAERTPLLVQLDLASRVILLPDGTPAGAIGAALGARNLVG
jgi:glucokinase